MQLNQKNVLTKQNVYAKIDKKSPLIIPLLLPVIEEIESSDPKNLFLHKAIGSYRKRYNVNLDANNNMYFNDPGVDPLTGETSVRFNLLAELKYPQASPYPANIRCLIPVLATTDTYGPEEIPQELELVDFPNYQLLEITPNAAGALSALFAEYAQDEDFVKADAYRALCAAYLVTKNNKAYNVVPVMKKKKQGQSTTLTVQVPNEDTCERIKELFFRPFDETQGTIFHTLAKALCPPTPAEMAMLIGRALTKREESFLTSRVSPLLQAQHQTKLTTEELTEEDIPF